MIMVCGVRNKIMKQQQKKIVSFWLYGVYYRHGRMLCEVKTIRKIREFCVMGFFLRVFFQVNFFFVFQVMIRVMVSFFIFNFILFFVFLHSCVWFLYLTLWSRRFIFSLKENSPTLSVGFAYKYCHRHRNLCYDRYDRMDYIYQRASYN